VVSAMNPHTGQMMLSMVCMVDAYPWRMTVAAPTLELLEWVAARMRTYDDVREAWRSNCPRYAVWDDAVTDGLVRVATQPDSGTRAVVLTPRGQAVLRESLTQDLAVS
jgi:hypothetical protein